jgi:hypothetical protein
MVARWIDLSKVQSRARRRRACRQHSPLWTLFIVEQAA